MTEESNERVHQFTELIRRLFEEAMDTGEMLSGEINIIIAAVARPEDMEMGERGKREKPHIREPVSERHEHEGQVTITADLPGTTPEDIQYTHHGKVLYLSARADGIIYRAVYCTEDVIAGTLAHTFKNGVIEFTYKKQDPNPNCSKKSTSSLMRSTGFVRVHLTIDFF